MNQAEHKYWYSRVETVAGEHGLADECLEEFEFEVSEGLKPEDAAFYVLSKLGE